jgi:hypothetical protein
MIRKGCQLFGRHQFRIFVRTILECASNVGFSTSVSVNERNGAGGLCTLRKGGLQWAGLVWRLLGGFSGSPILQGCMDVSQGVPKMTLSPVGRPTYPAPIRATRVGAITVLFRHSWASYRWCYQTNGSPSLDKVSVNPHHTELRGSRGRYHDARRRQGTTLGPGGQIATGPISRRGENLHDINRCRLLRAPLLCQECRSLRAELACFVLSSVVVASPSCGTSSLGTRCVNCAEQSSLPLPSHPNGHETNPAHHATQKIILITIHYLRRKHVFGRDGAADPSSHRRVGHGWTGHRLPTTARFAPAIRRKIVRIGRLVDRGPEHILTDTGRARPSL